MLFLLAYAIECFICEIKIKIKLSPYHPLSNGQAKRAVQIFNRGQEQQTKGSLECKLPTVLFNDRLTPRSTTTKSPAELLLVKN